MNEKMVIIDQIDGDLLEAEEKYIAQQCNCVTVTAHGLSKAIAARFPHGNVYGKRRKHSRNTALTPDEPGTVVVAEREDQPTLLHMMAQWTPSKAGAYNSFYPKTYVDTRQNRVLWFSQCLKVLSDTVPKEEVVAMPYGIGCGLAGGDWEVYKKMLQSCPTKIRLYRLK